MAIVEVIAGLMAVALLEPATVQTFQATRPAAAAAVIQSRQAADGPPAEYVEGIAPEHDGWVYQTVGPFDPISRGRVYIYRSGSQLDPAERPDVQADGNYAATITICPNRALHVISNSLPLYEVVQGGRCITVTGDDILLRNAGEDLHEVIRVRYRIVSVHPVAP